MQFRTGLFLFMILFCLPALSLTTNPEKPAINWRDYNVNAFEIAKKQNKFIILNLEAVWCHWCHVMDAKTYVDPNVVNIINQHFIAVKADHDARPDLAERYRDWGWPATIILAFDGTEIIKRAGYIAPEEMVNLLNQVINNPKPEGTQLSLPKKFSNSPRLKPEIKQILIQRHIDTYDNKVGGLAIPQKFLDQDSVEWDLFLSGKADKQADQRVRQTLDAAMQLIDQEFGGVYQYSTGYSWNQPHYEKIMKTQHRFLVVYSKACKQLAELKYCQAARQVASYLMEFMRSDNNGFYTSQDADLTQGVKGLDYFSLTRKQRLKKGLPRIDKHQYASENGLVIDGLAALYMATQEKKWLTHALQAEEWVWKNRRYADGGFRHDKIDQAGPYLSDTLSMGRAYLGLYHATANERYLTRARKAATFIARYFRHDSAGLVSATDNGTPVKPLPQIDQNIQAVRFFIGLYSLTKEAELLAIIEHTNRYLVTREIALSRLTEAGLLLIDQEWK